MLIVLILIASFGIALIRGGRIAALSNLQPRFLWLLFVPLALQIVGFSPLGTSPDFGDALARVVYLTSLAVAALALVLNRHLPGLIWAAVGLLLNFLVIVLNGGLMPVSEAARQFAGMTPLNGPSMNVISMTPDTLLPWFADILPLPAWVPLANVFSLGDILVTIGGVIFISKSLLPSRGDMTETRA